MTQPTAGALTFRTTDVPAHRASAGRPNPFDAALKDLPDGKALEFDLPYNTKDEAKAVDVIARQAREAAGRLGKSAKVDKTENEVKDAKGKVTGKTLTVLVYLIPKINRPRNASANTETPAPAETPSE